MKQKVRINGKEWNPDSETFYAVRKLPVIVSAIRLNEPFEVDTLEGIMQGNPGDWLIKGVEGELYPCKNIVFKAIYEILHVEKP